MNIDTSVNGLYVLLKTEQKTGEVISLPEDFYHKINEKLKTYGNEEGDEYKSILKITNSLKERRLQKILVYLAYNKELPRPLPSEEEDLYIQIKNIIYITNMHLNCK